MRRMCMIAMYRICLAFLAIMLLSSCWSRHELNAISVVLAFGVDRVGNEYEITVQAVDPVQLSTHKMPDRAPTLIVSERSTTLLTALRKITEKAPRKMYGAHLRMVIIQEKIAREEGIDTVLDLFLREPEVRPDFYVTVARDTSARNILALMTPFEVLSGMELYKSLETSQRYWAPTAAIDIVDIYQLKTGQGIELAITGLTLIGDVEKGKHPGNVNKNEADAEYQYSGIGVFRDDRLVGWLNETDSKSYNYLRNNVLSTVGNVRCPDGKGEFVVEVSKSKAHIKPFVHDGRPSIQVIINLEGHIAESACLLDMKKIENFNRLQEAAEETAKEIITHGISTVQKNWASDIYGFGATFYRHYPHEWHKLKAHWPETFRSLPVSIELKYKLRQAGRIMNGLGKETSEGES